MVLEFYTLVTYTIEVSHTFEGGRGVSKSSSRKMGFYSCDKSYKNHNSQSNGIAIFLNLCMNHFTIEVSPDL